MQVESHELPLPEEVIGNKKYVNIMVEEYGVELEDGEVQTRYRYHQLKFGATDSEEAVQKQVEKYRKEATDKAKDEKLERLTVTTSGGKVFYGDPTSRTDLADAIAVAVENGITSTTWKLAEEWEGSRYSVVTLDELQEARRLALEEKGKIVGAISK